MAGSLKVKNFFFDRAAIIREMDKGTNRALSKVGAFVRTRAKTSIKKRKSVSPPGSPPSSHTDKLKRLIFFSYDFQKRSVVIGPTPFGEGLAPDLLEHGGSTQGNGRTIFITRSPGRDEAGKFTSLGKKKIVLNGTINYKPRPYMGPALAAELDAGTVAEAFRDCIRT